MLTTEPIDTATALAAVQVNGRVELAAVVVSFDTLRIELARLATDHQVAGRVEVADQLNVLTVRARQALLGFFDRAERTPPPADAATPHHEAEEVVARVAAKSKARKGGGQ